MPDAPTSPVTLEEAKAHLRVDTTDDDALIGRLLIAASQFVENETNRVITDGSEVTQLMKQLVLLVLGHFFEQREGVTDRTFTEVPMGIQRLIWQFALPEAV
jgi:uncharacterized phage protein (predicted DNA packaging)